MALSMAYGTIATDDAILHVGASGGEAAVPFVGRGFPDEACALPAAPLPMPTQTIEADAGLLHRLLRRLRGGGAVRPSMDVGA